MKNPFESHTLKVESIKAPEGNQVSFCAERGGIITSLEFKGSEVLYLEQETLENKAVNVRGGIPILFPNAGPIESPLYPNLKQHGFARNSSRWKVERIENGFKETLAATEETQKLYPYDFRLSVAARFEEDGSFTMNQEVENAGDREMPLSMGLHPYFKVPQGNKDAIAFNFDGGKFIKEHVEVWANGEAVSIDNPKVKDPAAILEVTIPALGTLLLEASPEYKKIWVWSMTGKDFVCIEPVMRDVGGLVDDPEILKPNTTLFTRMNINLRK